MGVARDPGSREVEPGAERGVAVFERERPRLFGVAYRMLGSVHDAEDVLQAAYLRWHEAENAAVRNPGAWLVRFLLRLARKGGDRWRRELVWINGEPAIAGYLDGRLQSTISVETDGERVRAFYSVVNPEKLRHMAGAALA